MFGTTLGMAEGDHPLPALERISIEMCRQTENRGSTKASLRKKENTAPQGAHVNSCARRVGYHVSSHD